MYMYMVSCQSNVEDTPINPKNDGNVGRLTPLKHLQDQGRDASCCCDRQNPRDTAVTEMAAAGPGGQWRHCRAHPSSTASMQFTF